MRKRDTRNTGGTHGLTRKEFLNNSLAGAATLMVMPSLALAGIRHDEPNEWQGNAVSVDNREEMIFGWTTCLTYETKDRKPGYDYYSNLLDEMHTHKMSRLIVMMASHGYYSPGNHGLAWPAKNEKLKYQIDRQAVNAFEETEFFSGIIDKAHTLNIEVFIEIKYLGMIGVREGYPGIDFKRRRDGSLMSNVRPEADLTEREAIESLNICWDNGQAHQYMRDKISDVLTRYSALDGIVLEHPAYSTCFCESTRQRVKRDTGKEIDDLSVEEMQRWKAMRIRDTLFDLKYLARAINPDIQFGFYTGFSPKDGDVEQFQLNRGHSPEILSEVDFNFLMPYCEGRHEDNEIEEIEKIIDYLAPMDIYLHTVIRRDSPHNYQLPPKGPEYIQSIIKWGREYYKTNKRFKGMTFFNEVKIPEENRQAVYDSI
ncbi:MAG: hypothetical protein IH591_07205 [Bacteroidales bacterium]|nr:hypothetical protein [Bacteroidales bacterium]